MMISVKAGFGLVVTLLVLVAAGVGCQAFAPTYEFKGAILEPALPVPDFELNSTTGQPFRLSQVKGDIALIYFGYTYCPDVCPLTLADIKQAVNKLEQGRERVHFIFISVDPERDTPEALSRYVTAFDPSFIGLTDDFEKVKEVMKPYGAFAEKEIVSDSAAGYLVSHSARVYLVNADQNLLLMYPFGFKPEDLSSDLAHLLSQENS
ncbi:MAG: SCO family protein [Anaerolineales bacterium]|nr:SCO family protein [Anaerolineales bacterium]